MATKRIQLRISEQTSEGRFDDAIYFDEDVFNAMSQADIDAAVLARVNAHVERIKEARKPRPAPTREEKIAQREALREQRRMLKEQEEQIDEPETRDELVARRDELKAERDQVTAKLAGLRG